MNQTERANFGTKLGIILATAGSAVGLGNVWRFPYMTGQNGGAAFILVYIACVLILGIPCMLNEFIIGRRAQSNTARAYARLANGTPWRFIGLFGVFTGFMITGYYVVVSGWCLQYIYASAAGHLTGDADYVKSYFDTFSSHPWKPIVWMLVFMLMCHFIISRGVEKGIEKGSKMMMPLLFILLVVIAVASCMLPGASKGISFLFNPDFSKVDSNVLLGGLGQAFYSLSVGMGCLCTYASYFKKDINLLRSAGQIALLDTLIAVLAGLMIFPAAFSVGINPGSGASLVFITLPNVFQMAFEGMPVLGYVIGVLFYALLVFAALTSTISMHEIGTAFFTEELHLSRKKAVWVLTAVCSALAIGCSLSVGAVDEIRLFGRSLLDFCDFITAQIMLPTGAFLTSVFVGWFVDQQLLRDEFTNHGTVSVGFFRAYQFSVRFIVPLCILLIFLHQFGIL